MQTRALRMTALFVSTWTLALGAQADTERRVEQIRDALVRLPYYGVFDALSFSYDKGTVILSGHAYQPSLKEDAERVVGRMPGVDEVVNEIEYLPPSRNDDELRWRTFFAIYTNEFLSRYTPGGGLLWGHRDAILRDMQFGRQPVGNYPIHIIVRGGRITLFGMVDSEADKAAAGLAAGGMPGSFGVDNQLQVHGR